MFRSGQEIGLYTLVKRIGRGGFGEVWLAERRAKFVTTKVAVKLPLEEQVDHDAIKSEAVVWEQASGHPNVLPIIDADEYDGQIVIVSEYAPDGSLEELLQKTGTLPAKKTIELAMGILSGLGFLHSRKIIHRDLKPANILLQGETPRLADFGISRVMKTTSVSVHMSGTPSYMAPEAFDRKRNVQTDIWSVGVILYQMLKGSLPFPFSNITDLLGAIVMREPEPLPESIPQQLQEIVLKALAKNLDERYQTASEMRDDLANFLVGITQQGIQQRFQTEGKTEVLSAEPLGQTQVSPTMKSPVFVQDTKGQHLNETLQSKKSLEEPVFNSPKQKKQFPYLKILAPLIILFPLVAVGLYLLISKQTINSNPKLESASNTLPISTKDKLSNSTAELKKIRYAFVSTENLAKKISVSDEDLKTEYESLPADRKIQGVQGREIVLRVLKPENERQVLERANNLIRVMKENSTIVSEEVFAQTARSQSENPVTAAKDGKLAGLVRLNNNNPADPYQQLLKMKPGEVSDPIIYKDRYFILWRGETIQQTFEEAKKEIEISLRNRRAYALATELAQKISDDLKQTKDVKTTVQKFAPQANMNVTEMVRETPFIKAGDEVPDIGISLQFEEGIANLVNPNDVGDKIPIKNGFAIPILIEKKNWQKP